MNILVFDHVRKSYVSRMVLDDVSIGVDSADKIGVIGVNGTGKSTLLSIAAGAEEQDEGRVIRGNAVRISYLPQNPVFDEDCSILENVTRRITGQEQHWDVRGEARSTLLRFGILDPDCSPAVLSGGQKKRAALVAAILTPCDLLILDEPTNHLDNEMCRWLEDYLVSFKGAVMMVTHDRYFLDQVSDCILEIDRGKVYRYEANYSKFLELKAQRLDYAMAAERKAAALYRQDLKWMLRGARARSTKQKAHIQRFEALRDREKIEEEREIELQALPSRLGGKTIEVENISKSFDGRCLFQGFTYRFLKTDRIGIIGPNGCGKTTLLRCLVGEEQPDEGSVEIGQTVQVGYFSQESEALPENDRVIDFIRDTAEFIRTADGLASASSMCERFLFDGVMQHSPISKLSGGEKRRLYLLQILMKNPNVLILDEPTNDLDIRTLQILEDYLDRFAGIVIAVSHDRYFLDRVVTRIFAFEEGGAIVQSEGAYTDYLEHRRAREDDGAAAESAGTPGRTAASGAGSRQNAGSSGQTAGTGRTADGRAHRKRRGLSYAEQKEYDGIEGEIEKLEEELAGLDAQIQEAACDYEKLSELSSRREELDKKLDERMERYLELQEKLDAEDL